MLLYVFGLVWLMVFCLGVGDVYGLYWEMIMFYCGSCYCGDVMFEVEGDL